MRPLPENRRHYRPCSRSTNTTGLRASSFPPVPHSSSPRPSPSSAPVPHSPPVMQGNPSSLAPSQSIQSYSPASQNRGTVRRLPNLMARRPGGEATASASHPGLRIGEKSPIPICYPPSGTYGQEQIGGEQPPNLPALCTLVAQPSWSEGLQRSPS